MWDVNRGDEQVANVVLFSMFMKEDPGTLQRKIGHLFSKAEHSEHDIRFLWVVGKVEGDDTTSMVISTIDTHRKKTKKSYPVEVVTASSPVSWNTELLRERLVRLSDHVRPGLECLKKEDDYLIIHESDLKSQDDIIDNLVSLSLERDGAITAGWPVIKFRYHTEMFYDTWGYKKDGKNFSNDLSRPYPGYDGKVVELDSVGSVWCSPIYPFINSRSAWPYTNGAVEMCQGLKDMGLRIFADPGLVIRQPVQSWQRW